MIKESLIVRSSISFELIKNVLFKGFAIAFLGAFALLLAGIFLPLEILQKWGWILVLMSLGFITLGLLPYRRLSRLQLKSNELVLTDSNQLAFYTKDQKILTLPLQSIAQISYISHSKFYGIAVWLKSAPIAPVVIHQSPQEVEKLRQKAKKIENADLFFPYFNQRAYDELMDWQYEKEDE